MKQNMRQQIIALLINISMKISDIITETTAGAVATVAMPMGKMHKRNPSVFPKKKKTEDATGKQEDEFHKKLDKLVHKTFGHSSDEKKKKKKKAEEGKSPHKKGTKKYKKHMAAMHAGMGK